MHQVKLANTTLFTCPPEKTILEASLGAGITLEHSCRTGKCGVCKAKVLEGSTQVTQPESALSSELESDGYILTCCRNAVSDLVLDIEDLGDIGSIQKLTLPARIDSLELLSPDVIRVVLRLPPKNNLKIVSGQYIDVIGKDSLRRSYSIANQFIKEGNIELHIRRVIDGKMSGYWFESAKTSDLLRIDGPHGTFCFRNKNQSRIIFIATGTGMAPIKSMLEALDQNPDRIKGKRLSIYWGGRVQDDIYWQPETKNFDFDFHPVLSRADANWNGLQVYVQDHVIAHNPDMKDCVVYACGSPQMIDSANKLFISKGLIPANFLSDAFVSS